MGVASKFSRAIPPPRISRSATGDRAFTSAKEKLVSSTVLAHYDTTLPIKLAADASAYGVGAVISHVYRDSSERPVAFASRTLTSSERNYAQIEKEALALVYGVKYFHQYLYGRRFTLITDHKPLMTILGPKTGVPLLAAARLQRWALLLSAYCYDIEYKPTKEHINADGLSRLPLPQTERSNAQIGVDVFNVAQIDSLPVTSTRLGQAEIEYSERSGATRSPVGLRIAQITYNHTGRGGTSSLSKVIAFCGESEQLYHCHYRREYSKNCIKSIKELLR